MTRLPKRDRERELTRDEVFVSPAHGLPDEWARDNALFGYRLIKRSGWVGRLYAALFVALVVGGGIFGISERLEGFAVVVSAALFIGILVVAGLRSRR